jgi:AcrR family transcriptional regulator
MTLGPTGGGPGATTRRRENTRAKLLAAAEDVFVRKGLNRVTVDDLVGPAGFTRGAFYSNFASIEEVFISVCEQQSARLLAIVREVVSPIPEDEFTMDSIGLILDALAPVGRRWYVIQTEFTLLAMRSDSARQRLQAQRARLEGEMREAIGDVVRRLGREPETSIDQVAETVVALYLHSLSQEALGFGSIYPQQLVETVLPQVVLGLTRAL